MMRIKLFSPKFNENNRYVNLIREYEYKIFEDMEIFHDRPK